MPAELYAYCYRGLWRLLPLSRSENWQSPHHSVLAVVALMDTHLRMPRPDPFVVYLSGLLLGRICPLRTNLDTLEHRACGAENAAVRAAAHLALERLRTLHAGPDPSSAPARLPLPV